MQSESYCSWVVCLSDCVCVSVSQHLTSGASVRFENTVTYLTGNKGQTRFLKTAPLQRSSISVMFGCPSSAIFAMRKNMHAYLYLLPLARKANEYCLTSTGLCRFAHCRSVRSHLKVKSWSKAVLKHYLWIQLSSKSKKQ